MADALPALILDSARALFLEHGFAATSMQDIATRAGVTKRTLYTKVGDKEVQFGAVLHDMLGRLPGIAVAGGDPIRARLEQFGIQLLSVMLEPDMVRLNRVVLSEVHRFPALVTALVAQIEQGPIPQLAALLAEARGARGGPVREDQVSARLLYDMILGAPVRGALTGRARPFDITHAEWVAQAVAVFLDGWQRPEPDAS